MDELSKLLQIKEYVLEVKWNLAKLHTQKVEAIRSQYYETAAVVRQKERELSAVLLDTRRILLERKFPSLPTSEQMHEQEIVNAIISETSLNEEEKAMYRKIRKDYFNLLKTETKRLLKDKQELEKIKETWAVNEIHKQLLQIGEFLNRIKNEENEYFNYSSQN